MTDQSILPCREIVVHFDGSCLGNPGPGGWAAHIENVATGKQCSLSGSPLGKTTNGRMELRAALEALLFIRAGAAVTMVGDAQYVVRGASEWLPNWKAKSWRKAGGSAVVNADLWQEIDVAIQRHTRVTWRWQRGHVGHHLNEAVDGLAHAEASWREQFPFKPETCVQAAFAARGELELVTG